MEKVKEDMVLAGSMRHHGLENWKMMAVKFSNFIPDQHRYITEEEEDDVSAFIC
ncbi:hypothetical protein H5410_000893 [Solanum commersonii]|uniref:Uncharacterized protein n=1 Tax=Solanum commersonii TaxID=4109 RepID=A0A9J6AXG7_SOLCO|nr:hypothetical protein H5410_000893 [Solanum commersonii]